MGEHPPQTPSHPPLQTAPQCPICSAPGAPRYCEKSGWPIHRCRTCGHGFVFPRPTLADVTAVNAEETAQSQLNVPDRQGVLLRSDVIRFVRRIDRFASLRGRLLDVGAGDGAFSVALSHFGFTPHMIDLDPRCGLACGSAPGCTFARETFEQLQDRGPYALVVMSQVLEHALDPLDWLRRAHDVLLPGGMVAIALPNFGGIYRLLGSRDPYLIPPVHVNFFSPDSMRRAAAATGFEVHRLESDSRVGARRADGRIGIKRAVLSTSMALLSPAIDPFARGIILWAFLRKP